MLRSTSFARRRAQAAIITNNNWRFNYSHKCTFENVSWFPLPQIDPEHRGKLVCHIKKLSARVDVFVQPAPCER